ncbi:putative SAS-like centriolar protein [Hamiltosporidium magnivora]|uniref:Putative SAS-like centriolar protein n=1 Tax=Hamiltosporidium magnivora TaxID=148818 RepID=A0A4Q9KWV4_9MICR|nr:putative SAS-like centriolar protein [Hamiltosporidium magnivora]
MREPIFTGKVAISCLNEDIPSMMKCDVVRVDDKIEIRLIDTKDIFTFYLCSISAGEFYILKREQDIRVDFEKFVRKLIEMFHMLSKGQLIGVLSRNNNKFMFLEKNEFRNIVRLELKFCKPDENHYKNYLSDLITRLETDNIKLIKDNLFLKETVKSGDREMKERLKYLEEDYSNLQKKIERLYKENGSLNAECNEKNREIEKINSKLIQSEKDKASLEYEIEKKRIQEVKNENLIYKLEELDKNNKTMESEINTANDIIKKLNLELKEVKKNLNDKEGGYVNLKEDINKYKKVSEDLNKKIKILEEKLKNSKEEIKNKENKIKNLELERNNLIKKLENAQSVYNHFYKKNVETDSPNDSDYESVMSSIRPESPPH